MITLYTWKTPNGRKPAIMLEETGLAHTVRPIDITADQQFDPAFLAISPNNKIPAIVDDNALGGQQSLFESGAILTYLAAKSGRLLPPEGPAHWSVISWLHWSTGGLGPMLGQLNFFAIRSSEKAPLAIDRFTKEAKRLLGVMERRLSDIASYPWVHAARTGMNAVLGDTFEASPATLDWLARIGERPAVARGMKVLED